MSSEPFTRVGRITRTHGLHGEVSVASSTGASLSSLVDHEVWIVPPPRAIRSVRVVGCRPGPKGDLVTLEGIGTIDEAQALVGKELLAVTDTLPAAWLEHDVEVPSYDGFEVIDAQRGSIGTIVETLVTGANDVWVVEGRFGEVLVPVIEQVVESVEEESNTIAVRLLPGLMEDGE